MDVRGIVWYMAGFRHPTENGSAGRGLWTFVVGLHIVQDLQGSSITMGINGRTG